MLINSPTRVRVRNVVVTLLIVSLSLILHIIVLPALDAYCPDRLYVCHGGPRCEVVCVVVEKNYLFLLKPEL